MRLSSRRSVVVSSEASPTSSALFRLTRWRRLSFPPRDMGAPDKYIQHHRHEFGEGVLRHARTGRIGEGREGGREQTNKGWAVRGKLSRQNTVIALGKHLFCALPTSNHPPLAALFLPASSSSSPLHPPPLPRCLRGCMAHIVSVPHQIILVIDQALLAALFPPVRSVTSEHFPLSIVCVD